MMENKRNSMWLKKMIVRWIWWYTNSDVYISSNVDFKKISYKETKIRAKQGIKNNMKRFMNVEWRNNVVMVRRLVQ